MRFNTYYVRVRKAASGVWTMICLRRDCHMSQVWCTHAAAMAAADAHVHMHETVGAASS